MISRNCKDLSYFHFNFVIDASFQHENITKTWSIVIQISSHHHRSNVCNAIKHSFAIVMIITFFFKQ
jgi:hypothetical protein